MKPSLKLTKDNVNQLALVGLGDDVFWDCSIPFSPVGNWSAQQTLGHICDWRNDFPEHSFCDALNTYILDNDDDWPIFELFDWAIVDMDKIAAELKNDPSPMIVWDDFIIAISFANFLHSGRNDSELCRMAKKSLFRQSLVEVARHRDYPNSLDHTGTIGVYKTAFEHHVNA